MALNTVLATILLGTGLATGSTELGGLGSSKMFPSSLACSPVAGATGSGPVGLWGCEGEQLPRVTLNSDRTMSGYDGCNWFSGTWQEQGGRVVFNDDRVSTKRYCDYPHWFPAARSATVHENVLTVYNATGERLGALPRR